MFGMGSVVKKQRSYVVNITFDTFGGGVPVINSNAFFDVPFPVKEIEIGSYVYMAVTARAQDNMCVVKNVELFPYSDGSVFPFPVDRTANQQLNRKFDVDNLRVSGTYTFNLVPITVATIDANGTLSFTIEFRG